jgi:hypothetical protein
MNEPVKVPNPGSVEAVLIGCICAVADNHYGKGFGVNEDGDRLFWINGSCPIHARQYQDDEERE